MDAEIRDLKRRLNEVINQCQYLDADLKELCYDAASCLSIFRISIQSANHRNYLLGIYNKFLTDFQTGNNTILRNNLDFLIMEAARSITTPLQPVQSYLNQCFQECKNNGVKKLSHHIGYVVGCSIYNLINTTDDFQTCWQLHLEGIFREFQIIQAENNYLKKFLAYFLCEEIPYNYQIKIKNHGKIVEVCNIIFGNVRNFKFFKKACLLSKKFEENDSRRISKNQTNENFKFSCSKIPRNQRGNQILQEGQQFMLSVLGISNSYRVDKLVLFGKHPLCDVRLPEDNELDDICFAICHNDNCYIAIDCSKKACIKRKFPINKISVTLERDMIIDIVHSVLLRVLSFNYREDEDGTVDGEMNYEYLSGELFGAFGGNTRKLSTIQGNGEKKYKFLLGKGEFGKIPDIRLSQDGLVGREHMWFEFSEQKWIAYDNESKNGTFILFKNHDQYQGKIHSSIIPLFDFDDEEARWFTCISINQYSFIFMPNDS